MRRRGQRDIRAGEICINRRYSRKRIMIIITQMRIRRTKSISDSLKINKPNGEFLRKNQP